MAIGLCVTAFALATHAATPPVSAPGHAPGHALEQAGELSSTAALSAPDQERKQRAKRSPLQGHVSPYLGAHAGDPVAWQPWGRKVFEQAQARGQLMFVSVGYFACHWCHVMQRESFHDVSMAALLNDNAVSIKIDRELRPALDAHLIDFVERTTGRAGWPLNVLLTPQGYPLLGFTYLPNAQLRGLLEKVFARWESDATELSELARRADSQLRELRRERVAAPLDAAQAVALEARLLQQIMSAADTMAGGFGEQAKFPSVPQLRALLDVVSVAPGLASKTPGSAARIAHAEQQRFLELTLDKMSTQGLRDQVGGGFFRYVVDPNWEMPHFEKMLYDNALLAQLYADAGRALGAPRFSEVAADTIDFMVRELWDRRGAFIASLSAVDVDNVEGGYYLITPASLAQLPTSDRELLGAAWGLRGEPQTAAGFLPRQIEDVKVLVSQLGRAALSTELKRLRTHLRELRRAERLPRDDKWLAAWNGLALSALLSEGHPKHAALARKLVTTLATRMWDGTTLARSIRADTRAGAASLQDYAYVTRGLWDAAVQWNDAALKGLTRTMVLTAWHQYFDATAGGWRLATNDQIVLADPVAAMIDRSRPAPGALLMQTTLKMVATNPDELRLRDLLGIAVKLSSEALIATPYSFASHVRVVRRYHQQIGDTGTARGQ
jgi:uncharacterized protein